MPDFVESADNARTWQMGMATAGLEMDVVIQWCYATPTDILAALEMPAVTNFRWVPCGWLARAAGSRRHSLD